MHFLFLAKSYIDKKAFVDSLGGIGINPSFLTDYEGEFDADQSQLPELQKFLSSSLLPAGSPFSFLVVPHLDGFSEKLIREALDFYPNEVKHISDIILKEMSFGDYSSFPFLSALFHDLPDEILISAKRYLDCGMDGLLAAEALYIHRNTFNYRIKKFIELTGVDIREFHNALLFEIYLKYLKKS